MESKLKKKKLLISNEFKFMYEAKVVFVFNWP